MIIAFLAISLVLAACAPAGEETLAGEAFVSKISKQCLYESKCQNVRGEVLTFYRDTPIQFGDTFVKRSGLAETTPNTATFTTARIVGENNLGNNTNSTQVIIQRDNGSITLHLCESTTLKVKEFLDSEPRALTLRFVGFSQSTNTALVEVTD